MQSKRTPKISTHSSVSSTLLSRWRLNKFKRVGIMICRASISYLLGMLCLRWGFRRHSTGVSVEGPSDQFMKESQFLDRQLLLCFIVGNTVCQCACQVRQFAVVEVVLVCVMVLREGVYTWYGRSCISHGRHARSSSTRLFARQSSYLPSGTSIGWMM